MQIGDNMKVLVTGAKGQLGQDLIECLSKRGITYIGAGREEFDLTDEKQARAFIRQAAPDAVIHCGAYTMVDKAEDEEELCRRVNAEGTKNIAGVCKEQNLKMLYLSTDYVFSGEGERPYEVHDATAPESVYGKTKLEGEKAVQSLLTDYFIVRISWVFGKNGNNFVKTMLRLGEERDAVNVVEDQIGSPTYTKDLAPLLCDMIMTEKYGIYHASNEGYCSWAEFAEEIFSQSGQSVKVNGITTEKYPTKAKRPKNSRLSKESLDKGGFSRLPQWKEALNHYFSDEKTEVDKIR